MSGAEMTIRLVDGSEAEQAAFNRGPDDHEPNHVPSVGGIDTGNSQRSDTVEAIAAGFATITDKESKDDSQHDTTATVAAIHEQFADIANGSKADKSTHQQGDPIGTKTDGPTTEDYRGYRVALEQLVQRFTPKFFSEPMDRLIAALNPRESKPENRETQAGPPPVQTVENSKPVTIPAVGQLSPKQSPPAIVAPPVQTAENRAPIIPAVGHVAPKQDEGIDVPAVGHVAPETAEPTAKAVSVGDIIATVQQRIAKIPVVGKRINGAINAVRSTANKLGGFSRAAKSLNGAIGKTRTGKALLASGSKLASKIKGSSFGKAVAGAGRSVVGAVARTVGATAGGAVVSGTGAATAVAAGGTAAGSGAPAVAAAAPLLANPVGLAVGAVAASFAALALATKALNDTFTSEADRLEQYSSAITMAKAKQQISTEMNMLSRAKEVGPGLAKFTEAQTRYQDATQELWTSILGVLLKTAPVVEVVADSMTALVRGVDLGVASVEQLGAVFTADQNDDAAAKAHAAAAGNAFAAALQDILRNNAPPQNGPDPMLMALLNARP